MLEDRLDDLRDDVEMDRSVPSAADADVTGSESSGFYEELDSDTPVASSDGATAADLEQRHDESTDL